MERTMQQWRNMVPEAVADGSRAQIIHALKDAKRDIEQLSQENANLRGLLWSAWFEFNAIRARHGAPISTDGVTLVAEEWWSQMTEAFAAAIGPESTKPWPSLEAKAAMNLEPLP